MRSFFLIIILGLATKGLISQSLFQNTNYKSAVQRGTRSINGKAGLKYWQNRANYNMHITFDPATGLLSGEEIIDYSNNSPDTLKQIILRLYPDFYKKGINRTGIKDEDLNEGVVLEKLIMGSEPIPLAIPGRTSHHYTNLLITPAQPILPGTRVDISIAWHYTVNKRSPVRTGMVDEGSYFIAYFYPRVSVYDDINGWDDWTYNGTQEFYNDFGDFIAEIKLPKYYVAWATGERMNPDDNLAPPILQKLKRASASDDVWHISDSSDYNRGTVFSKNASGAWKFKALNVSDFVFALSDHYLWDGSSVLVDSTSGRRTLASAVFNKQHSDYFDVAKQAHESVYYMSHYYPRVAFPFPYITVFDGTDQMEYPMMVNDNPTNTHKDAVQLTSHEIFHSYFPFYMGINETQYGWMDEGWATIGESVISPLMGEPEDEGIFSKTRYEKISGTNIDLPLISNTKLYQDAAYVANIYGKAGICYWVLQDMLGDNLYFKALHQYMSDWHGKHPIPYDFFYSFNTATGKDLDWFWQKWFFEWVYPDLSIKSVATHTNSVTIKVENKGGLPLPLFLDIKMESGDNIHLHYGAEIWKQGNKDVTIVKQLPAQIRSIELGHPWEPDKFKSDNSWIRP